MGDSCTTVDQKFTIALEPRPDLRLYDHRLGRSLLRCWRWRCMQRCLHCPLNSHFVPQALSYLLRVVGRIRRFLWHHRHKVQHYAQRYYRLESLPDFDLRHSSWRELVRCRYTANGDSPDRSSFQHRGRYSQELHRIPHRERPLCRSLQEVSQQQYARLCPVTLARVSTKNSTSPLLIYCAGTLHLPQSVRPSAWARLTASPAVGTCVPMSTL